MEFEEKVFARGMCVPKLLLSWLSVTLNKAEQFWF